MRCWHTLGERAQQAQSRALRTRGHPSRRDAVFVRVACIRRDAAFVRVTCTSLVGRCVVQRMALGLYSIAGCSALHGVLLALRLRAGRWPLRCRPLRTRDEDVDDAVPIAAHA